VATRADGRVARVLRLPGSIDTLAWLPDGRGIVFGWRRAHPCVRAGPSGAGLFVAALETGAVRELPGPEAASPPRRQIRHFAVVGPSADGRRVLYVEELWPDVDLCGLVLSGGGPSAQLRHVALEGGRPTPVAGVAQAAWSPEGDRLAFETPGPSRCRLAVSRPDGSAMRVVLENGNLTSGCSQGAPAWFAWSPRGDELYAATDESVVAVALRNVRLRLLLGGPVISCGANYGCSNRLLAVARDGGALAIAAEGIDRAVIVIVSTRGGVLARGAAPTTPYAVFLG
jgi:hypothetical protein